MSSKSRSTRKNHIIIDIEHSQELQEAKRELRTLEKLTDIVGKKMTSLKHRIKELEGIIAETKSGGGKRKSVSFRNKNGSPLQNVRNFNANGELRRSTRNHSKRARHSPPSNIARQKWENALEKKERVSNGIFLNSENENLGDLFRRQMQLRHR